MTIETIGLSSSDTQRMAQTDTVLSPRFYTTDFADQLQNQIIPALRAGFVVLTDRYIFSIMARAEMS